MKFKQLMEIDTLRSNTYIDFEKRLNQYREKYPDKEYDLDYSDNEHLIIQTENILEYTRNMHEDLCNTFDVKLILVNRLQQQSGKGEYLTIEYIYEDQDSLNAELKWENIRL